MLTNNHDKTRNINSFLNKIMAYYNMESNSALRIRICNSRSVELFDLTKSLFSAAAEYKIFIGKNYKVTEKEEAILYVREIKSGSIIIDLISQTIPVLAVVTAAENVATVIHFGFYLKACYDYLLGKTEQKPVNLSKTDYQNLSNILEPTAKDNAGQINISQVFNGDPTVILNIPSIDANAIQNMAKREIEKLLEPVTGLHKNVVLYWQQVNKDTANQAGDRVIIESISSYPVKVIFENETALSSMILGIENPLIYGYLVDVFVDTIEGKPVLYKIQKIHQRIEYPPQTIMK